MTSHTLKVGMFSAVIFGLMAASSPLAWAEGREVVPGNCKQPDTSSIMAHHSKAKTALGDAYRKATAIVGEIKATRRIVKVIQGLVEQAAENDRKQNLSLSKEMPIRTNELFMMLNNLQSLAETCAEILNIELGILEYSEQNHH